MRKVLPIQDYRPEEALERLNRITGLDFGDWPESLLRPNGLGAQAKNVAAEQEHQMAEYLYSAWQANRR